MKKLLLGVIIALSAINYSHADNEFVRSEVKTYLELNGAVKSAEIDHLVEYADNHDEMNYTVTFDQKGNGIASIFRLKDLADGEFNIYRVALPYHNNQRTIYSMNNTPHLDNPLEMLYELITNGFTNNAIQTWSKDSSQTFISSSGDTITEFFNDQDQLTHLENKSGSYQYHYFTFQEWQAQDMSQYNENDLLIISATVQDIGLTDAEDLPENVEIRVRVSVDKFDNPIKEIIYKKDEVIRKSTRYEYY